MENLIFNSDWDIVLDDYPEFFTLSENMTFDDFEVNGYRTCSLTKYNNEPDILEYDLFIDLDEESYLMFGLILRAINVDKLLFVAEFFDINNKTCSRAVHDVTEQVYFEFANIYTQFDIPKNACYVKLSVEFYGDVTACTFCDPGAYGI